MIDFFHKDAEMTKRITGTAKLKGAPTGRLTRIATFKSGAKVLRRIFLEVADTPRARQRGLMGRTDIPTITGMLFEGLSASDGGAFWMKGCEVPIDVAFLDKSGKITKTYAMTVDGGKARYPYDATDVAALEVAGGCLKKWKVSPGCTVTVDRLVAQDKEAQHG